MRLHRSPKTKLDIFLEVAAKGDPMHGLLQEHAGLHVVRIQEMFVLEEMSKNGRHFRLIII